MFRYGGEEFVLLLSDATGQFAQDICQRILKNIETDTDRTFGKTITVSIGLVSYDNSFTVETLLKAADKKLYSAKEKGKNRVVGHSSNR